MKGDIWKAKRDGQDFEVVGGDVDTVVLKNKATGRKHRVSVRNLFGGYEMQLDTKASRRKLGRREEKGTKKEYERKMRQKVASKKGKRPKKKEITGVSRWDLLNMSEAMSGNRYAFKNPDHYREARRRAKELSKSGVDTTGEGFDLRERTDRADYNYTVTEARRKGLHVYDVGDEQERIIITSKLPIKGLGKYRAEVL